MSVGLSLVLTPTTYVGHFHTQRRSRKVVDETHPGEVCSGLHGALTWPVQVSVIKEKVLLT